MQPATQQDNGNTEGGIGVIATAVSLIRCHAGDRQPIPRLSAAARTRLVAHPWEPGLAGLEDCIQRALVLCDSDVIEPFHLALTPVGPPDGESRETAAILASLRAASGRRSTAAARLGIAPRTLRLKLADLRARGFAVPAAGAPERGVRHG